MPTRDWNREVHENLAEDARREASIFWNKALARRYIDRGVSLAVVVVLTYSVSYLTAFGAAFQKFFVTISFFGAMAAACLMLVGVVGLAFRHKDAGPPDRPPGGPPPIGW